MPPQKVWKLKMFAPEGPLRVLFHWAVPMCQKSQQGCHISHVCGNTVVENSLSCQKEHFPHTNLGDCPQVKQAIWPPGQDVLSLCKPVRHAVFSILSPSRKACGGQGHSLLLSLGVSSVMDRQVIYNPWVSAKQGGSGPERGKGRNREGAAFTAGSSFI